MLTGVHWLRVVMFGFGSLLAWIGVTLPAIGETAAPGTPPGISSLSYFLGTWNCQGIFPSNGKKIASTIRFAIDGASLVKHHDDLPPNLYHAIELWGYSPADRQFNAVIEDNFGGTRDFSSTGWTNNSITWTSKPQVVPRQEFAYTKLSDASFRLDWQVFKNGGYVVGDTLTCTRTQ